MANHQLKRKLKRSFIIMHLSILLMFFQNCGTEFESNLQSISGRSDFSSKDDIVYVSKVTTTEAIADGSDLLKIKIFMINDINNPVSGVVPKFTIRGDYEVARACTESDLNGVSECDIKSTVASSYDLSVTYPSLYVTPISFKAGSPWELKVLEGDGQSGTVSNQLLIEPKFQVLDKYNNPIKNTSVNFLASNSGVISNSTVKTDDSGVVSPGIWTLGAEGTNTLTAQVGNLSKSINAEAISPVSNPMKVVYLPAGSCSTGKIEVYINNTPHPKYQFVNSGECIEIDKAIAEKSLKVRCIDPQEIMSPSDFVGPAILNTSRNPASDCSIIHKG